MIIAVIMSPMYFPVYLQWTTELCGQDSDGDGRSNGEELGDPGCTWSVGGAPQVTEGITHPGETGDGVFRMLDGGGVRWGRIYHLAWKIFIHSNR